MTLRLVAGALLFWALFATLYQAAAFTSLALLLRRRARTSGRLRPRCTFLRPLVRADASKEANLDELAGFGIPIVAGVRSARDPAMGMVRRVKARNPHADISVRAGGGPPGANRKVANLIQMLPLARGEILIFTDADVRLHPASVDVILAPFEDPAVGLVTCPYRSVAGDRLLDRMDILANNTVFLPSVALAERVEGVQFALGACIALRREVLAKIGGLHFLLDMLPDDYALGAAVLKAGYVVALSPVLLDHCVNPRSWLSMARRHRRWARTIHLVRPWAHFATVLTHGLIPALALLLLGGAINLGVAAAWLATRLGSAFCMRQRLGLSAKDFLLLPVSDLFNFVIFLLSLIPAPVWWDNRRMAVRRGGLILSVLERSPQEILRPEYRTPAEEQPAPQRVRRRALRKLKV